MKRPARLLLLLALALSAPATAQDYETTFDDASGWTLESGPGGPWWAVDATPASTPAGAFRSAPASLNFNDGTDVGETSGWVPGGQADSPPVDISSSSGTPVLRFWCNFDSEEHCTADRRTLIVSNDDFDLSQPQLIWTCLQPFCGGPNHWHEHVVDLDPSWGTVRVRFEYDAWDNMHNGGTGWFIDDLSIELDPELGGGDPSCVAVPNSTGQVGRMRVLGSTVVADDDLTLLATDLPPTPQTGYFLMGSGTNTFTPPGSAGPICIAPGLRRYLPPPNNTFQLGGGFLRSVGTSGPISGAITAGSTWGFQAWHRDGAGPSNLTGSVRVTFQ